MTHMTHMTHMENGITYFQGKCTSRSKWVGQDGTGGSWVPTFGALFQEALCMRGFSEVEAMKGMRRNFPHVPASRFERAIRIATCKTNDPNRDGNRRLRFLHAIERGEERYEENNRPREARYPIKK